MVVSARSWPGIFKHQPFSYQHNLIMLLGMPLDAVVITGGPWINWALSRSSCSGSELAASARCRINLNDSGSSKLFRAAVDWWWEVGAHARGRSLSSVRSWMCSGH